MPDGQVRAVVGHMCITQHHTITCAPASMIKGSEADRINLTNVACRESWHCSAEVSFCPADRSSEINMSDTYTPYDISERQVKSIYSAAVSWIFYFYFYHHTDSLIARR